jgi:hypothetical protein
MTAAREKLHVAVQLALRANPTEHWLTQGQGPAAAHAFFAYISQYSEARAQLTREHQQAFDETIGLEASQLWSRLDDDGKVALSIQLHMVAPKVRFSVEHLVHLAKTVGTLRRAEPLLSFVLGLVVWDLCQDVDYIAQDVAIHLAQCHVDLQIWERANNRPWRTTLPQQLDEVLRQGWQKNHVTYLQRLQAFRRQLQQLDTSWLGQLLQQQSEACLKDVERDIQREVI